MFQSVCGLDALTAQNNKDLCVGKLVTKGSAVETNPAPELTVGKAKL